jgi:ProP effector
VIRPGLIVSALKMYTRSVGYLETLKAGTPRIDLDGNPVREVTLEGQEYAQRKLAKVARSAAAKAIEDREAANQAATKPIEKRAEQQNPIPEAKPQQPTPGHPRVGLAGRRPETLAE